LKETVFAVLEIGQAEAKIILIYTNAQKIGSNNFCICKSETNFSGRKSNLKASKLKCEKVIE